ALRSAAGAFLLMCVYWLALTLGRGHYGRESESSDPQPPSRDDRWSRGRGAACIVLLVFRSLYLWLYAHVWYMWVLFCEDRLGAPSVLGVKVQGAIAECANPVSVLLLTPAVIFAGRFLRRKGFQMDAPRRLFIGIMLVLLSLLVMGRVAFF